MAGDLAPESRLLVPHPLLDEGMADAVHEGGSARRLHAVAHGARGAHVVDDAGPGLVAHDGLAEQRGHEVAGHELPGVVDEEAAVRVAVPGDAEVGLLRDDPLHDLAAVRLLERIGRMVGEGPVQLEVHLHELEGQPLEDGAGADGAHPVARVEDHLHARDAAGIDEGEAMVRVLVADRAPDERPLARALVGEAAGGDGLLDLLDAGVAAQRQGPAADHLDAVVLPGIVGGGDHGASVEVLGGHVEIEHVRPHHADVGDVRPLAARALDEAARDLGRGEPHVASHGDAPGRAAQVVDEGAADAAGHLAVDLPGMDGADVVGLEDGGIHGGHARILRPGPPRLGAARASSACANGR